MSIAVVPIHDLKMYKAPVGRSLRGIMLSILIIHSNKPGVIDVYVSSTRMRCK